MPCSSFPCFFGKRQGKPPKRQGFFLSSEPLKSLGKKGKTRKKARNCLEWKKARKSKKQGKEDQGVAIQWARRGIRMPQLAWGVWKGSGLVGSLDGRNRAIVIAESLARIITAIQITSVRWRSYLPLKTQRVWSSQTLRSLRCDSNRAIGVRWCSIRSTWACGMACESWPRSLNASDWRFCPSKVGSVGRGRDAGGGEGDLWFGGCAGRLGGGGRAATPSVPSGAETPTKSSENNELSGLQKGPAERGHVKKRQKSSKSVKKFFGTFRQFSRRAKNVKNRQKMSKSFSTLFDNFRAAPFFRPLLQIRWVKFFVQLWIEFSTSQYLRTEAFFQRLWPCGQKWYFA